MSSVAFPCRLWLEYNCQAISDVIPASPLTCKQYSRNIRCGFYLSFVACTHWLDRTWPISIVRSLQTSTIWYKTFPASIIRILHTSVYLSQISSARISSRLHISIGNIRRCLPPLSLANTTIGWYSTWISFIIHGLHTIVRWCRTWPACVAFDLHTNFVPHHCSSHNEFRRGVPSLSSACTHWSATFKFILISLSVSSTHLLLTSNMVYQRIPYLAHIDN